MATNTYEVLVEDEAGSIRMPLSADGYQVKDDGWVHFYLAGPTPEGPKETIWSFSPKAGVMIIEKVPDPLVAIVGEKIVEWIEDRECRCDNCRVAEEAIRFVRRICGVVSE